MGADLDSYANVYAQFGYTVTFDKKGGTGGTSSKVVASGATVGKVTAPTLSGWVFRGYTDDFGTSTFLYVNADGTATTRTISTDKTLYANWTKTVTLNGNGATTAGSLKSITAGIGRPLGQKCSQVASSNADYPIRSLFKTGITDNASWAPTRTGYEFAGYYDTSASTGGTCWISKDGAGEKATSALPSTLYARWRPVVTFDRKGGTGGTESKAVDSGSTVGTVSKPALSGWTFQGYTDDFATNTYQYVKASGAATTRTITGPKTLYANWTKTVALNGNGATTTGSLKSITAGIGRPLGQKCAQVASNDPDYPIRSLFNVGITDKSDWAPTRTGYTFAGYWSTSASTGGTCWITKDGVGSTVTSAIPSTLYARWTPNTYTCTFNKKGGTGGSNTAVATYKAALPTVTKPALSGWTFQGYTDDFGTSTYQFVKASGAPTTRTWDYSSNKTLLANWTKTVNLNANNGTAGSLTSLTAGIGRPLGQKCNQVASNHSDYPIRILFKAGITDKSDWAPTRTGYAFAGYYDTSASTGGTCWISKDGVGSIVTSAIPSTLYARWTPNTYTVKFSVNGGAGSGYQTADKTATYGSAMPAISTTKPTRTGYTFMGWYDNSNYAASGAKQYYTDACKSARSWDKASDATLYAGWKAKDYVVTLDDARGTGASQDMTITYNKALPDVQPPVLPGWEFRGYARSFGPSVNLWWDRTGHSPFVQGDVDGSVYAQWTKSVALDPNGGSAGSLAQLPAGIGRPLGQKCSPSRDYAMNNELSAFLSVGITDNADWAPTRAGYTFAGYYDTSASTGGTCMVSASGQGSEVAKDTPNTLYARWAPLSYAISYDAAGGELPQGAREGYVTGDAFDLPSPVRYGYQFDGWEVAGVAEDGSLGPVQGAGVETATAPDGSKVTRVKAGTYGDLSCTARWTLRYDLDVPVCDPGSVTFEADSLTGQVRVAPGTSAEGAILSYMAVPVALDSLSCEGLDSSGAVDASGDAPELEAIFGAGSAAKVRFTATVGEGEGAATAKVTAGGASGSASLAGLSVPAATSHANPGRIRVSYGLELDPDLPIPPVRDAAPVARLAYTVSLPPAGA